MFFCNLIGVKLQRREGDSRNNSSKSLKYFFYVTFHAFNLIRIKVKNFMYNTQMLQAKVWRCSNLSVCIEDDESNGTNLPVKAENKGS